MYCDLPRGSVQCILYMYLYSIAKRLCRPEKQFHTISMHRYGISSQTFKINMRDRLVKAWARPKTSLSASTVYCT